MNDITSDQKLIQKGKAESPIPSVKMKQSLSDSALLIIRSSISFLIFSFFLINAYIKKDWGKEKDGYGIEDKLF